MQKTQKTWVRSLGQEDPLEEGMAIHSSIVAWRIPWTEEPGGLQSMETQRVRHNLATKHTHNNNNVFKNSKQSAASTTLLSRYAEN